DAELFERILQGQRIDHGRQHPHIIAGSSLDASLAAGKAAENIATTNDDDNLDAQLANFPNLFGHVLDRFGSNAHAAIAAEGLAAQFQEDPAVFGLAVF